MKSEQILGQLPKDLRNELLQAFNKIIVNFRESKWEPSELNGGKLCEVVFSILRGYVDGVYPSKASKPSNMLVACQQLEQTPSANFPRSVRIQIPRMLIMLYEVRNNRGVGHIGGEVNPNHMDATLVLYCSKWLVAELIRIFHNVDIATATMSVEELIEKEMPVVWRINGKKRILPSNFTMKEKVLLLLYSEASSINEIDLFHWVEHSNASAFRRDILLKEHKKRLWEYDAFVKNVTISPLGVKYVEDNLI